MKTKSKASGYIIRSAQKPLFFLLFASGLCSLWAQTPSPTPPTYLATDLGGLGGAGGASFAGGINNRGEVVGISFIPDVETGSLMRGFLYSGGLIRDLGTLGGGESRANGINDAGQIVGSSNTVIQVPNPCADPNDPNYDPDACQGVDPNAPYYVYPEHAFLYSSNGGMTDIGHDLGLADNYAYAINSSGQVAGTLFTEEDSTHAFRYSSNVLTDLDPNGNQSEGYAINDGGQVVGFAVSPEGGLRTAVFFNAATTFLGSGSSQGFSINSSGQVAGFAWVPSQHAVVYTDGVMADLGTLGGSESRAWGINSAGHVVGFAKTLNNADQHAFLYFGGAMYDLNNLVTGSTVPMLEARAINDSDQIAATGGPVNGQFHAFLLRPVVTATAGSNISSAVPADASYTMVAPITNSTEGSDNTTVSLLGGTATSANTVNVIFSASSPSGFQAASDVVSISGTGNDTIVLQMSYNEDQAIAVFGSEADARLMWLDPADNQWKLAVAGNTGGTANDLGAHPYNPATDFQLGNYGVDTANNVVWAVINHNSYFAIGQAVPVVYSATVQQPINADGTSIFTVRRGVVPVKFTLAQDDVATCDLPPATIAVTRTGGGTIGAINESTYNNSADNGSNFRIDNCQYVFNLNSTALGGGTYRVDILISGHVVGSAVFQLK